MSLCLACKKVSHSNTGKFCSLVCYHKYRTGKQRSEDVKKKIREAKKNNPMTSEMRSKMSVDKIGAKNPMFGKSSWNKGLKGFTPWNKGKKVPHNGGGFKKGIIPWNKGMKGFRSGEKNSRWRGGITPENEKARNSFEGRLWRKACMERDNFTCQKMGVRGGELQVHHINNFSSFPELRFAIDNGITLSKQAHKEFHKIYGKTNNTREQLNEFLIS